MVLNSSKKYSLKKAAYARQNITLNQHGKKRSLKIRLE